MTMVPSRGRLLSCEQLADRGVTTREEAGPDLESRLGGLVREVGAHSGAGQGPSDPQPGEEGQELEVVREGELCIGCPFEEEHLDEPRAPREQVVREMNLAELEKRLQQLLEIWVG